MSQEVKRQCSVGQVPCINDDYRWFNMDIDKNSGQFADPFITATGETRASVKLGTIKTLWFNTGTLCNLACESCYIESSPVNDRLSYISLTEVQRFLNEIQQGNLGTQQIGLTGGEPFMNPDIIAIMAEILRRGFNLLVLTNAMRPMLKCKVGLLQLQKQYGAQLTIRVSVDHYRQDLHEEERGAHSWKPMLFGLSWLGKHGFNIHVAGRRRWGDDEEDLRDGFTALFDAQNLGIDAGSEKQVLLFPEMNQEVAVPEITSNCWDKLAVNPDDLMCASSRMVIKRKGDTAPVVVACTLLPYDEQFVLGTTLAEASTTVQLNHHHCANFCVLGGGSCTAADSA